MVAPDAPVLTKLQYGTIASAFYRYGREGKVFYAGQHGKWTFSFPVLKDGAISRHGGHIPYPTEEVEVIHPRDLGITEFKWVETYVPKY